MERRVTSHTEEEELNQRKHLLDLARKGDKEAIERLLELYQVQVYSGDNLPVSKGLKGASKTVKAEKVKTSSPSTKSSREKKWSAPVASLTKQNKGKKEKEPSKKAAPQAKKAVPQAKKAVPQAKKAVPQAKKAVPQEKKAVPQAKKAVPQAKKAVSQTKKAVSQTKKAVPQGKAKPKAKSAK